jgi:hypothetical protein
LHRGVLHDFVVEVAERQPALVVKTYPMVLDRGAERL